MAAGAVAALPITAQADVPGHPGWHYVALGATTATYSADVAARDWSSDEYVSLVPGKWNRSNSVVVDNKSYRVECFDSHNHQVGHTGWFTPHRDGRTWWYVNLHDACGV